MLLTLTITEPSDLPGYSERCKTLQTGTLIIGRSDKSENGDIWCLPSQPEHRIGREHCDVKFENGNYYIIDQSKNGVFLNKRRIEKGKKEVLQDGDHFSLCDDPAVYVIKVSLSSSAPLIDSPRNKGDGLQPQPYPDQNGDCCIAEWLKKHYQEKGQPLPCKKGQPPPCTLKRSPRPEPDVSREAAPPTSDFNGTSMKLTHIALKGIIELFYIRNKIKEDLDIPRKTIYGTNSLKDWILSEPVHDTDNRLDSIIKELLQLQPEEASALLSEIIQNIIDHEIAMLEAMRSLPKDILNLINPRQFESHQKNHNKRWDEFKKKYDEFDKCKFEKNIATSYEKAEDSYRHQHAHKR